MDLAVLDWRFNEYECLPLLVTLLLDEGVSKSNETLDAVYSTEEEILSTRLWQDEEIVPLLKSILASIRAKEITTAEEYPKSKIDKKNFSKIYLEPSSFFRWCEKEGYEIPYPVSSVVRARVDDLRVRDFEDYTILKAAVSEKLREPLWRTYHAIMYLFGFEPPNEEGRSSYRDLASRIVWSHEGMKSISNFLSDAEKIGDIRCYSGNFSDNKKVKPLEFMKWAERLGMDFPNLIVPDEKRPKAALHSKEKETLLKLLLGMALTNYEYDPLASRNSTAKEIAGDLDLHGMSVDEDTVRKWLNEAKEFLPKDWTPNK